MFRNPRENAVRDSHSIVKPSVGRPPSPDSSADQPRISLPINSSMASKTSARSSSTSSYFTPRKTSSAKEGAPPSQPPLSSASKSAKAKTKQNGSILNFFKRADTNENGTLFVEDQGNHSFGASGIDEQDLVIGNEVDMDYAVEEQSECALDDTARYHEHGMPVKKRKYSDSSKDNDAAAFDGRTDSNQDEQKPCTPPPPDFDDERNMTIEEKDEEASEQQNKESGKRKQRGGFLVDSDSEGEDNERADDIAKDTHQPPNSEAQRFHDEESSSTGLERPATEKTNGNRLPPQLNREATSLPDQGDFEGFEDMGEDDVDEYVDGEEYSERRWMAQQRQREMADDGFEGAIDDDDLVSIKQEYDEEDQDSGFASATEDTTNAASCPICSVSLAGCSDQDASVHVNSCLDGNPTPLPSVKEVKSEQETAKAMSASSAARFQRPLRPAKPGQGNPFDLGTTNGTSSAFSKLMSGHAEDAAWATAAASENKSRGKPAYQRTCPFYKILPGFFICVDAFRYGAVQGCNGYFLSHFHSDHYIGLTATWSHGPIYCSKPTANLVKQQLRVNPQYVVALEFDKKVEVPGTQGVFVTMIPANHCPGSSLYLFEKVIGRGNKPKVQRVLHCGDFRACPAHIEHPLLKPEVMDNVSGKTAQQKIDVCYLDTTYLNPRYAFPSQEDVIQACADMCVSLSKSKVDERDGWEQTKKERAGGSMANFVRKDSKDEGEDNNGNNKEASKSNGTPDRGRLLVIVGTYSIGKERICLGIAQALNSKIYAPPGKQRICAALEDAELNSRLTSDPRDAQVHMTPLFEIRAETLGEYLADYRDHFSRAVGFRPSGWNYRPPGSRFTESPAVSTVLYSENWKSGYSMKDLVPQRGSTTRSSCFGVPYSEHSSFRELTMFCCALNIEKVIPTVNVGSAKSRERMKLWCERWAMERKKNGLFKVDRQEDGANNWYPAKGTWELKTTL